MLIYSRLFRRWSYFWVFMEGKALRTRASVTHMQGKLLSIRPKRPNMPCTGLRYRAAGEAGVRPLQ